MTQGHIKIGSLSQFWKLGDLQKKMAEAAKAQASSVSSTWRSPKSNLSYMLTARINAENSETLWTLLSDDGKGFQSLWSAPFQDLELLLDVLELTLAKELDMPQQAPPQQANTYAQQSMHPPNQIFYQQQQQHQQFIPYQQNGYPPANLPANSQNFGQRNDSNYINPISTASSAMPPGAMLGIEAEKKPEVQAARVRPNVVLGKFLLEAHLIPQHTIDGALLLQDMVKSGALEVGAAAEALARAHNRSGAFDTSIFLAKPNPRAVKVKAPPLGELLINAGLINLDALTAALTLQESASRGQITNEEALKTFAKQSFGSSENADGKVAPALNQLGYEERAVQLLVTAKLIANQDLTAALKVQEKSGGYLLKILESASRIDDILGAAALRAQSLIDQRKLKEEQVIIVLYYVQRSRVSFDEAMDEMGWEKL